MDNFAYRDLLKELYEKRQNELHAKVMNWIETHDDEIKDWLKKLYDSVDHGGCEFYYCYSQGKDYKDFMDEVCKELTKSIGVKFEACNYRGGGWFDIHATIIGC